MKAAKRTIGPAALLAVVLLSNIETLATPPVRIAAQVMASATTTAPITVTVTDSAGDTLWSRTSQGPHFAMRLPGNERYIIHFQQPQCREKEVVIDALRTRKRTGGTRMRKVSFAVVLEADPQRELRYARPVGRIDLQGTGRASVEYDYALVKAEK